jgi:hypothetical protein
MSALPPKADILQHNGDVRFVPRLEEFPRVAEAFGVSETTIKFHLKNLFEKTGAATSRVGAIADVYAYGENISPQVLGSRRCQIRTDSRAIRLNDH